MPQTKRNSTRSKFRAAPSCSAFPAAASGRPGSPPAHSSDSSFWAESTSIASPASASETAGILTNDVEPSYNRFVVQERAKWESERRVLTRTAPGQPTYMVATLVVLLRQGSTLPDISGATDLRQALQNLAAEVSVEDNLMGAELLWTPEDANDVMDRDDMFLNFPELVTI